MVTQSTIKVVDAALKVARLMLLIAVPASVAVMWATTAKPARFVPHQIQATSVQATGMPNHELQWYAPLWERDLKQPPLPPTVAEPSEESKPAPGPIPALLATFVEPRASYAHLIDSQGKVHLKTIDDVLDHFRVLAIEPGRVRLQNGDGIVWVAMPEPKDR